MLGVLVAFAAFALNFGAYRVFGDGVNYYAFTERLFGDTSGGTAYNFGAGLMNAPFYGVAKLAGVVVAIRGSSPPRSPSHRSCGR